MKSHRQLILELLVLTAWVLCLVLISIQPLEVQWAGLHGQGARLFNHGSLSVREAMLWSIQGTSETFVAPLAAIFVYLISEWAKRLLFVNAIDLQSGFIGFVFALGVINFVWSMRSRYGMLLALLGAAVYSALAVVAITIGTALFIIALLPLLYPIITRPRTVSIWFFLALVGMARLLGTDTELLLFLVLLALIFPRVGCSPHEWMSLLLMFFAGCIELGWLSNWLSVSAFPYATSIFWGSGELTKVASGFQGFDFHQVKYLAFAIGTAPLLTFMLERRDERFLSRALVLTMVSVLLIKRSLPLFALIYAVSVIEITLEKIECADRLRHIPKLLPALVVTLLSFVCVCVNTQRQAVKTSELFQSIIYSASITKKNETTRIFNDWRVGDALVRAGFYPFADSRVDLLPLNLQDYYARIMRGDAESVQLIAKSGINLVITHRPSVLCDRLVITGAWQHSSENDNGSSRIASWRLCHRTT